jgi:hypothetical protein
LVNGLGSSVRVDSDRKSIFFCTIWPLEVQ